MRLSLLDFPDLPLTGFRAALGKNRPATLEKSAGNAPNAPDPYSTANAVMQSNQQNAAYNKALNIGNYSNPFGSQQSTFAGFDPVTGAPRYQTSITANPQLQAQLNSLLGQAGQSQSINQSAIGGLYGLNSQFGSLGNQAGGLFGSLSPEAAQNAQNAGREAAYKSQAQYLDPQFSQREQSLEAKLAAQGLAPGSQAYSNAIRNFGDERQRAYSDAANQAILTGSQIGTQNLQNQLASLQAQSGLLNQQGGFLKDQQGAIGQLVGLGQLPYSNLQALNNLIPGYTGIGQSSAAPSDLASYLQNEYLGRLGQYNAQQQGRNATLSSLGSLAGGLFNLGGGGGGLLGGLFGGGGGTLGTAGSALSSLSPGLAAGLGDALGMSLGGTYGAGTQAGLDALIGSLGGFSGGGTGAATGAAAGASGAAGGAGGAGSAAGASGSAGGLGAAAGAALPAAVLIGGVLSMLQPGTQPIDISGGWQANAGNLNQSNFNQFVASDPSLNAVMQVATQGGGFDYNRFEQAVRNASVGGKRFEGEALQKALQFGQLVAAHPEWLSGSAATQEAWWSPYAQGTPSN